MQLQFVYDCKSSMQLQITRGSKECQTGYLFRKGLVQGRNHDPRETEQGDYEPGGDIGGVGVEVVQKCQRKIASVSFHSISVRESNSTQTHTITDS